MNSFWILKCTSKVGSPLMCVWWNISEPGSGVKFAEPDSRARLVRVWAPLGIFLPVANCDEFMGTPMGTPLTGSTVELLTGDIRETNN
jgi:hypothetical protein